MIAGGIFADVAAALAPSVVLIRADTGAGAGVLWSDDGCIVTAAHLAREDRIRMRYSDGRQAEGTVVARDLRRDLALVVPNGRLPSPPPLPIGDPGALRPGSLVFALGHPLGIVDAVTTGVFQAVGPLPGGLGPGPGMAALDWVQADLSLAPGNSGGPVADAAGRVIGLATMVVGGLALAVPAAAIARFVSQARAAGREFHRARIAS